MGDKERDVRRQIIEDVYGLLLGPKHTHEIIDESPLHRYVTGILAPRQNSLIKLDVDDVIEVGDAEGDADAPLGDIYSPVLDPGELPRSMGVEFQVEGDGKIAIIVTWAKYYKDSESKYRRNPRAILVELKVSDIPEAVFKEIGEIIDPTEIKQIFPQKGDTEESEYSTLKEIRIHIARFPQSSDSTIGKRNRVLIILENPVEPSRDHRTEISEFIFQPVIRVAFGENVRKVPLPENSGQFSAQQFVYRDIQIFGRGLMCSATWKELVELLRDEPYWPDKELVRTSEEASRVLELDYIQTIHIPIASTPTPEYIHLRLGGEEIDLETLSEIWSAEKLSGILKDSVLIPYVRWIAKTVRKYVDDFREILPEQQNSETLKELKRKLNELDEALKNLDQKLDIEKLIKENQDNKPANPLPKDTAKVFFEGVTKGIINEHVSLAKRIAEGIRKLRDDKKARLAFLFACKAMALQHKWSSSRKFVPRVFQLAFLLANIPDITDRNREKGVDLLWVPTGGGKTAAYLLLTAFTLAYRRLRYTCDGKETSAGGVGVISRYTLRLLTIQQFRRTLRLVTAMEILRNENVQIKTQNGPVTVRGWRPSDCNIKDDLLWGEIPFRIGLWVGGGITPNKLKKGSKKDANTWTLSAIDALKKPEKAVEQGNIKSPEPAQILRCPVCGTILSVPPAGIPLTGGQPEKVYLTFVVDGLYGTDDPTTVRMGGQVQIEKTDDIKLTAKYSLAKSPIPGEWNEHGVIIAEIEISTEENRNSRILPADIDKICQEIKNDARKSLGVELRLVPAHPARPGYFIEKITKASTRGMKQHETGFKILCPNPRCSLNTLGGWVSGTPSRLDSKEWRIRNGKPPKLVKKSTIPEFETADGEKTTMSRVPVPALTVDEQIYRYLPDIVISTVDKFAALAWDPESIMLFGDARIYVPYIGYFHSEEHVKRAKERFGFVRIDEHLTTPGFDPPELIIQDEIHLISGPLGTLVGDMELALDFLIRSRGIIPKYVVSSATVNDAEHHAANLYGRNVVSIVPPIGYSFSDSHFIKWKWHSFESENAGRIYLGLAAPGKGPITPLKYIISTLTASILRLSEKYGKGDVDPYYTIVAYFNAIRELAGAATAYKEDIPERIIKLFGEESKNGLKMLSQAGHQELSSRISSTELPIVLEYLERSGLETNLPPPPALFTTNMFGVGVDIPRLSLMVVNGQPKSTSEYIQATGRVGRKHPGIVITFYRTSKPRDLSHYELFAGYHLKINLSVEPQSITPLSRGAIERMLPHVITAVIKNHPEISLATEIDGQGVWIRSQEVLDNKYKIRDAVEEFKQFIEKRYSVISGAKIPLDELKAEIDRIRDSIIDKARSSMSKWKKEDPARILLFGFEDRNYSEDDEMVWTAQMSLRDVEKMIRVRV